MKKLGDPLVTQSVTEAIGRMRGLQPATLALFVGALSLPSIILWFVLSPFLIRYFWDNAKNSTPSFADVLSKTLANWRTILLVVLIVVLLYAAVGALGNALSTGLQALDWGHSGGLAWWDLAIVLPFNLGVTWVVTAAVLWSLPLAVIGERGAVKVVKQSVACFRRQPASSLVNVAIVVLPPVIVTVIGVVLAQGIWIAHLVVYVAGAVLRLFSIVYLVTFLAAENNPVLENSDNKGENE